MSRQLDSGAFIEHVENNSRIIHKVCNIYCNTLVEKEDMKQEIILQLWRSYPQFQQRSKFSTWMYRIAINTAITNIRKSKRNPLIESVFEDNNQVAEKEDIPDLSEEINELYRAISKLNETEKAIIMLYLEEKPYKEIGEIIGISEKNVSVKLVRIKSKLQKIMTKKQA